MKRERKRERKYTYMFHIFCDSVFFFPMFFILLFYALATIFDFEMFMPIKCERDRERGRREEDGKVGGEGEGKIDILGCMHYASWSPFWRLD